MMETLDMSAAGRLMKLDVDNGLALDDWRASGLGPCVAMLFERQVLGEHPHPEKVLNSLLRTTALQKGTQIFFRTTAPRKGTPKNFKENRTPRRHQKHLSKTSSREDSTQNTSGKPHPPKKYVRKICVRTKTTPGKGKQFFFFFFSMKNWDRSPRSA